VQRPGGKSSAALLAGLALLACTRAPARHDAAAPVAQATSTSASAHSAPLQLPAPASGELRPAARVVAQGLESTGFITALAEGERFALLGGIAVDLVHGKVAWRLDGEFLAMTAGKDRAVYVTDTRSKLLEEMPAADALHVIDLISGARDTFAGRLMADVQLPPHLLALREGETLALVDPRRRAWAVRVATEREPQALALSADGKELYVLEWDHTDENRNVYDYEVWLELFRAQDGVAPGTSPQPFARYAHTKWRINFTEIDEQTKFDEPSGRRTYPRLYYRADGALILAIRTGCPVCRLRAPEAIHARAIDVRSGDPAGNWTARMMDDVPALEARVWDNDCSASIARARGELCPPAAIAAPAAVQRVLDGLPGPDFARSTDPCHEGACFATTGADKLCLWSLQHARPIGCRALETGTPSCLFKVRLVDESKVFLSSCDQRPPALTLWNPQTNGAETWRFEGHQEGYSPFPFVFAPSGLRFLKHVGTRSEAWTWGRDAPDWVAECLAPPRWSHDAATVLCPRTEYGDRRGRWPVSELDAKSGKERKRARRELPWEDLHGALPCGLSKHGHELRSNGDTVASAYAFDDGEWAFVLPTGEHSASARATAHLTFYAADGTLLDERSIAALARPDLVAARLTSLATCTDASEASPAR
jgi:hypothetical protein